MRFDELADEIVGAVLADECVAGVRLPSPESSLSRLAGTEPGAGE